ncbi:hypothetical protein NDU88_000176 [Pleurodeles waltl]|uniref:Uncharacterized protein n=1 Tax=Pleurodeles waltl TaxID=8319 RepID=A0AAV7S711_PLEWA|nr:hypothetical protein NDU88_000176 [Pleurodeles waltl]
MKHAKSSQLESGLKQEREPRHMSEVVEQRTRKLLGRKKEERLILRPNASRLSKVKPFLTSEEPLTGSKEAGAADCAATKDQRPEDPGQARASQSRDGMVGRGAPRIQQVALIDGGSSCS